jgi:hypothetical protein
LLGPLFFLPRGHYFHSRKITKGGSRTSAGLTTHIQGDLVPIGYDNSSSDSQRGVTWEDYTISPTVVRCDFAKLYPVNQFRMANHAAAVPKTAELDLHSHVQTARPNRLKLPWMTLRTRIQCHLMFATRRSLCTFFVIDTIGNICQWTGR